MKKLILILLITFSVSQVSYSQMPGNIKGQIIKIVMEASEIAETNFDQAKQDIQGFLKGAPNNDMKIMGLGIMIENSTSGKLTEYLEELAAKLKSGDNKKVSSKKKKKGNVKPVSYSKELGIEPIPASFDANIKNNFNRYTKVVAPNGKPIHIIAQDLLTDEQIIRCRSVLEHFLADYPGSKYGADKGAIANKMTENNALLALLNGKDDGENPVEVNAQSLFQNEIQVEGHSWYINQDFGHRDATYEEILHFVHDNGIGVDGPNTRPGVAPEFQKEIRAAQVNGIETKIWAFADRFSIWLQEIMEENSASQEYLASLIDSYYGLWGAWEGSSEYGMWGGYVAKVRSEIASEDPMGAELMNNKFFHPYLTYNARIDASFEGTFSLAYNEEIPYSHHSQYLKDITLLGAKNTSVVVNELDNDITGNEGLNTVVFSGNSNEYEVNVKDGKTFVNDKTSKRDGKNTLSNIEKLQFSDKAVDL